MKKLYTFLILVIAVFSMNMMANAAPNLEILVGDKNVSGSVDDDLSIRGVVKNVSTSQSVITLLKVYMEKLVSGQSILVCWGDQCLPPIVQKGLTQFTEEVVLMPGENSEEKFHCGIEQGGMEGEMIVTFVFYDKNNPSDSAAFTTIVTIGPTGVEIKTPETFSINPNPAFDYINVNFDSDAELIKIYDMMGMLVSTTNVDGGNARIDVSALPQGVYLLNAYNRDGSIYTRRFVVSR